MCGTLCPGKYANADGSEGTCDAAPQNGVLVTLQPARVTTAGACEFECGAGFMRTGSDITVGGGGTCVALSKGKFFPDAPARQSGTESDCDAAPSNGDFVPTQPETVIHRVRL